MQVRKTTLSAIIAAACILPVPSWAASNEVELLKQQLEIMQKELKELRSIVNKQQRTAATKEEVKAVKQEVKQVAKAKAGVSDSDSVVHLAGYGSVGYTDAENSTSAFNTLKFNPIFHYQYRDLIMLEAELEIEAEGDGTTAVALEYATIDWIINDYAVLLAGKFQSPIGQFRQNLHPDWINKLSSAPPGFGHAGAAPIAEVGLQLRGGFNAFNNSKLNYAVFMGNGPELVNDAGEVHEADTGGFKRDADGNKLVGGRVGFLPFPMFEVGLSGAIGDAAVVKDEAGTLIANDPDRDYDVFGADFAYKRGPMELRGEYVEQKVGAASGSVAADSFKWSTWYAQTAYQFLGGKWEGALRYTDYSSPHSSQYQEQWAVGLNYLLTPNAIAKFGYEFNDGAVGQTTDDDRLLLQLTYGF